MDKAELDRILEAHLKWLAGEPDGAEAYLSRANLSWANLSGADLSRADLSWANLSRANLSGANLSEANLLGANLSEANLSRADLSEANLSRANLSGAKYNVNQVLVAKWSQVSPALCNQLMVLDAKSIPDGMRLMSEWAAGGPCPLSQTNGVGRVANFFESRRHWNPDADPMTPWDIWEMLAAEKGVRIRK